MLKTQITNSCTCTDENGEPTLYDCYGCWHDVVNEFTSDTEEFFNLATHGEFRINGLPLWSGDIFGVAKVADAKELLRAITVNGDWQLSYCVEGETLHCLLSHHDVPTGKGFTVEPIIEGEE